MSRWLAMVVYRCEVAGVPTNSLDFQVRYFELPTESSVEGALLAEPTSTYLNDSGDTVTWPLSAILAIEELRDLQNGDEPIGFIAQADEIPQWALPAT